MPLIIPANTLSSGYEISNSGRFNDGQSQALTRTHGASGSTRTFTFSCWVKFSDPKTGSSAADCCHGIFASEEESGHQFFISTDENIFRIADYQDGSYNLHLKTNRLFRDYSAWYHFCIIFDTTDGTQGDRCKLFVNGVRETSFSTETYPSVNTDLYGNGNQAHFIGRRGGSNTMHFDGYMADVNFIDGTAVACTEFGETNDNGVWIPKKYSGSYGNNGFFLEFGNTGTGQGSGRFASDTSGQGNHYDTNNFSGQYQMTDTPTNNFATWNPLHKASNVTLSQGNCYAAIAGAGQSRSTTSTIAVSKGKWYFEIKYTSDNVSGFIGLVSADIGWNINATEYPSSGVSDNVGFNDGGTKYVNGTSSSYGSGFGNNDIIGVAANLDDDEVVFYVNGTAQNSGTAISKTFSGDNFFVVQHQSSNGTSNFEVNFGNPTFSISSGNSDANGYGNFEYAVPSGYYALCTKNLAEYG